ncbi:hypothetical protein JCM5296_003976 [Sporobolomyces johnsonii]
MPPVPRTRSGLKNGPPAPYTKPERKAKPASTLPTPLPASVPQVRKRSRDDADDSVDETTLKRSRVESPATTSRKVRSLPKRDAKNTKPAATVVERTTRSKALPQEVKNTKPAAAVAEKATSRKVLPKKEVKNAKPVAAVAEKATEKATSRKVLPKKEVKNAKPVATVVKKTAKKNAKPVAAVPSTPKSTRKSLSAVATPSTTPKSTPPTPASPSHIKALDSDSDDSDSYDSDGDDSDSDMSDSDDSDSDLSDSDMSDDEPFVRVYVDRECPQPVSKEMGGLFVEMAQPMLRGLNWRSIQFPDSARFSEVLDE